MADIGLDFWLTQWNWEPSILIGTVLIVGLYLYAVGPLRKKHHPGERINSGQVFSFLLGMFIMFLALVSPLDELGDSYLFSAHMVQHLCLTIVGPPLLLIGTPGWLVDPLLRKPVIFSIARALTFPAVAFFLFNFDFWLWHAPSLYNATLENQNIHILEHVTFIVFGVLNWWPIFSPSALLPRLSIGGQVLYLFLSGMPTVALGAGLTFFPPLYAPYLAAPRIWGLSPASDQQLGGLIMWVPGNIAYIFVVSILFIRWMQGQDAKQREQEALQDGVENEVILQ
ncbi:MAG TPA: cytochrome c oxidase assembly protein [Ktedonobacter sp.]|jgi:cytochrome c oxidase assembly factor CtaG|nr:cytochrome c oxidase assembly protein [Ktedonobacter sp.]HBE24073.1 cytochrome c oxidase assembly protein [Ktedonobacter sp.]